MSIRKQKPQPRSQPRGEREVRPRGEREAQGAYWIYGVHAVEAALANPRRVVRRLACTRNAQARLGAVSAPVEVVEPGFFTQILGEAAVHQGMAALVEPFAELSLEAVLAGEEGQKRPLVVLDQVTDPHNVGAILRSAAAFGAAAVIVTGHHAAPETATLAKAASGALEIVPLATAGNLAQGIELMKKAGFWVAGLDGEAQTPLHKAKLDAKTALVLGAEGKGLRRLTAERCDVLVKLPIAARMESLNVSNACAVALYELMRDAV